MANPTTNPPLDANGNPIVAQNATPITGAALVPTGATGATPTAATVGGAANPGNTGTAAQTDAQAAGRAAAGTGTADPATVAAAAAAQATLTAAPKPAPQAPATPNTPATPAISPWLASYMGTTPPLAVGAASTPGPTGIVNAATLPANSQYNTEAASTDPNIVHGLSLFKAGYTAQQVYNALTSNGTALQGQTPEFWQQQIASMQAGLPNGYAGAPTSDPNVATDGSSNIPTTDPAHWASYPSQFATQSASTDPNIVGALAAFRQGMTAAQVYASVTRNGTVLEGQTPLYWQTEIAKMQAGLPAGYGNAAPAAAAPVLAPNTTTTPFEARGGVVNTGIAGAPGAAGAAGAAPPAPAGAAGAAVAGGAVPAPGAPPNVDYQPQLGKVTQEQTVQGQLNTILTNGNPLLEAARARAMQAANARGLQNSSMASQSGEEAIVNTALPIATSDAAAYQKQALVNQDISNQFLSTKMGAQLDLQKAYEAFKQNNFMFDKNEVIQRYINDSSHSSAEKIAAMQEAAQMAQASASMSAAASNAGAALAAGAAHDASAERQNTATIAGNAANNAAARDYSTASQQRDFAHQDLAQQTTISANQQTNYTTQINQTNLDPNLTPQQKAANNNITNAAFVGMPGSTVAPYLFTYTEPNGGG